MGLRVLVTLTLGGLLAALLVWSVTPSRPPVDPIRKLYRDDGRTVCYQDRASGSLSCFPAR